MSDEGLSGIGELPAALPEALPIASEAAAWNPWWWLALLLAAWLVWRWRRSRRSSPPPVALPPPRKAPSPVEPGSLDALRHEVDRSGDYREGCHRLAELVRRRLRARLGSFVETATAEQIRSRDAKLGRFFVELRGHQFERAEPQKADFHEACRSAGRLLGGDA